MHESSPFDALNKSADAFAVKQRIGRPIVAVKATKWWKKKPPISGILQHLLFLGGLGFIIYGTYLLYHWLAPIVGGVVAISLAFVLSSESDSELSKKRPQGR